MKGELQSPDRTMEQATVALPELGTLLRIECIEADQHRTLVGMVGVGVVGVFAWGAALVAGHPQAGWGMSLCALALGAAWGRLR